MSVYGNKFIFSIPFIGDPNLMNDRTHKQFMTKEQWIQKIESFGIKLGLENMKGIIAITR